MEITINNEIITINEVAKLLHSDKRTIQKKAIGGFYPKNICGKHGRYWLFKKQALLNFIFDNNS